MGLDRFRPVFQIFSIALVAIGFYACAANSDKQITLSIVSPDNVGQLSALDVGDRLIIETTSGEEIWLLFSSYSGSSLIGNIYSDTDSRSANYSFLDEIELDPGSYQSVKLSIVREIRAYKLSSSFNVSGPSGSDMQYVPQDLRMLIAAPFIVADAIEDINYLIDKAKEYSGCENTLHFGSVEEKVVFREVIPDDLSGDYCLVKQGPRKIGREVWLNHSGTEISASFGELKTKDFTITGDIEDDQIKFELTHFSSRAEGTLKMTSQGNLIGTYAKNPWSSSYDISFVRRRPEKPDNAGNEILGTTLYGDSHWIGVVESDREAEYNKDTCFDGTLRLQIQGMTLKGSIFSGSLVLASVVASIDAGGQIHGQVLSAGEKSGKLQGWLSRDDTLGGFIIFDNQCELAFSAISG